MKTVEEKAKAYDEALERAKKYNIDDAHACQGTVVKLIFPELAESEDERIRKALVKYFEERNNYRDEDETFNGISFSAIIAYLEKQKKQKSIPSREMILGIWELGNFWRENPEARDGLTQLQYIQKYWNEKCDYQKEQKPEERFEEAREKYQVEWSEEDIDASIKSYSDSLPMCGEFQSYHDALVHAYRQGIVNAFKFLRLQPNQEWSEENKIDIELLISLLREKVNLTEILDSRKESIINFLKSIHPFWKPSEEQMRHLHYALTPGSAFDLNILNELYEQLKKLM